MKIISFKTTKSEMQMIVAIVNRAQKLGIVTPAKPGKQSGHGYSRMTCDMDLTACHCNGNPLDLAALLGADDFNFTHDLCGIARHIDRETGKLMDCFVPRMSAKEPAAA